MDWNFIKQYHLNPPIFDMKRKDNIQQKYIEYKKTFNINDFKKNLFKNNCNWIVRKNDFPYEFKDNTKHYLIWFKEDKFLNYNIINFLFRDYEFVCFENINKYKSITEIRHIHIFIR